MNKKIFIEYDNNSLSDMCNQLYNLFFNKNYSVILLDNNLTIEEKKKIIEKYPNSLLISSRINNSNSILIIYPLRSNDTLAKDIYDELNSKYLVEKYYQLRSPSITNLDYYEILRNIGNNDAIMIKYGNGYIGDMNLTNLIFRAIIAYLDNENIYIVKSGDSLYSIAKKFNTTVDEIKKLNNLTSNNLSINQKLMIPVQNNNEIDNNIYIVKSGDSLYSIAKKYNTTVDEIKKLNNLTSNILSINQKLIIPNSNIYIVKSGDSLYSIAKKFNTTVDEIKKLNNLTSNVLSINQKLIIP